MFEPCENAVRRAVRCCRSPDTRRHRSVPSRAGSVGCEEGCAGTPSSQRLASVCFHSELFPKLPAPEGDQAGWVEDVSSDAPATRSFDSGATQWRGATYLAWDQLEEVRYFASLIDGSRRHRFL